MLCKIDRAALKHKTSCSFFVFFSQTLTWIIISLDIRETGMEPVNHYDTDSLQSVYYTHFMTLTVTKVSIILILWHWQSTSVYHTHFMTLTVYKVSITLITSLLSLQKNFIVNFHSFQTRVHLTIINHHKQHLICFGQSSNSAIFS